MKTRNQGPGARRLDKLLFEAGQQCPKRLYLDYHQPVAAEPSEQRRAMSEAGRQLVELARSAFPRGAEAAGKTIEALAAHTKELLATDGTTVVFGAAFVADDLQAQTDIVLRQATGELDLYEVKTGTKVNARYVADLSLQVLTIEQAGFKVRSAHVLHVSHKYHHKEGEDYAAQQVLKSADVTERVRRQLPRTAELMQSFRQQIKDDSALGLPTGTFCTSPFPCPHLDQCAKKEPAHPLRHLPDLSRKLEDALHQEGIDDLLHVDAGRPELSERQRQTLRCIQQDQLIVEPFVRSELRHVEYPLHFVAVAGITQALPRFDGQRPWRHVPYAWAAETIHEDRRLDRAAFVYADRGDPRSEFVRTIAKQLESGGILMCWGCESLTDIRGLLEDLPTEKQAVRSVLALPHIDLLRLFESGVFHPRLHDWSLANTVKVLLGDESGAELPIHDEDTAFAALQKAWTPRVRAATKDKIAADLKAWVEWQAGALVALHRRFGEIAEPAVPAAAKAKTGKAALPRKQLPPT